MGCRLSDLCEEITYLRLPCGIELTCPDLEPSRAIASSMYVVGERACIVT